MVGESGDDALRGGSGKADQVGYEFAPGPIVADLGAGTSTGDGIDTLSGFEALFGSYEHNDTLIGDDRANGFHGYGGNDVIDGAGGRDLYTYSQAPGPVVADLAAGTGTGEGNDTLVRIEDLNGSVYDDQLAGDDFPNRFLGLEGDDVLRTRAGDDLLDGHEGTDLLDGGAGIDRCWNGETLVDCETAQAADSAERLHWREPRLLRILVSTPSGLLDAVASRA